MAAALLDTQLRHQIGKVATAPETVQRNSSYGQAVIQGLAVTQPDGQALAVGTRDFTAIRQACLLNDLTHFKH
jgi:hypothetical protein